MSVLGAHSLLWTGQEAHARNAVWEHIVLSLFLLFFNCSQTSVTAHKRHKDHHIDRPVSLFSVLSLAGRSINDGLLGACASFPWPATQFFELIQWNCGPRPRETSFFSSFLSHATPRSTSAWERERRVSCHFSGQHAETRERQGKRKKMIQRTGLGLAQHYAEA